MQITKELLDRYYTHTFDIERFRRTDPCGVVYQLIDHIKAHPEDHPNAQLDIELGGLFVALITWGSRVVIYPTALRMIRDEMCWSPSRFILSGAYEMSYLNAKNACVYRTLNVPTFKAVCRNIHSVLNNIYAANADFDSDATATPVAPTLERLFEGKTTLEVIDIIAAWLSPARVGSRSKSACKRICMYIRWMTRTTVPDLGVWRGRSQADLYAVLDTHVMQLSAGMLRSRRPSWKACEELTAIFRSWDPADPLKYDIALMTLADHPE